MRGLSSIRIFGKELILIILAVVSLLVVSILAYSYLDQSKLGMEDMYKDRLLPIKWLNDNRNQSRAIEADLFELMITTDEAENKRLVDDITARIKAFDDNLGLYEKTRLDPFEVDTLKTLHPLVSAYRDSLKRVMDLAVQNRNAEAYSLFNSETRKPGNDVHAQLKALAEYNAKVADQLGIDNETRFGQAVLIFLAVTVASVLLVLLLGIIIARSISVPVGAATAMAETIASGDLRQDVPATYLRRGDEIGKLAVAFRDMIAKLRRTIADIATVASSVSSGSEQISTTAQQLSQGATEQAANAEEVSSSVEEMAATVRQNSDNSLGTEAIAVKAAKGAQEGGAAVGESVSAMKAITDKIGIVEEIARQTNLLALNAAIEAARAGESGKGFAVVASEVRKLAERSQTAAGEISALSATTMARASAASATIQAVVPDIKKTTSLVQEIAAASREQGAGIEQIGKAMVQLDAVIQQNASSSEELASMAEELTSQAQQLADAIAFFKVGDSAGTGLLEA
jgi:methyl-accepting chemotaxis protein